MGGVVIGGVDNRLGRYILVGYIVFVIEVGEFLVFSIDGV